jgi:hypothetical protein
MQFDTFTASLKWLSRSSGGVDHPPVNLTASGSAKLTALTCYIHSSPRLQRKLPHKHCRFTFSNYVWKIYSKLKIPVPCVKGLRDL